MLDIGVQTKGILPEMTVEKGFEMIKIEAIVREDKFEDVKQALQDMNVHGITVYQVMGCGTQKGYTE